MRSLPIRVAALAITTVVLGVGLEVPAAAAASEGQCDLAAAAGTESFLRYWEGLGGEVQPEDQAQAILTRAGDGDRSVLGEIAAAYEGDSVVSMTMSAAGRAAEEGHGELAKELLAQLDVEALDDRAKAGYASVLIRLDEVGRADQILAALEPGTFVDGVIVVHLISEHGIEGALERLRELSSHPLMGVANAMHLLEREGDHDTRRELLGSQQLEQLVGDSSSAAMVIPEVESVHGVERALALVEAALAELDKLDPSSRKFHLPSFVNLLARGGCSDACLRAAAEPIRIAASSDPEWKEHWLGALAATGRLDVALAGTDDPGPLLHPAKEWEQGRGQPRYLLPLLSEMPAEARTKDVAWSAWLRLWSEDDPRVLAELVALAGPITDPAPWAQVVGTLVRPSRITEEVRRSVREQLVRSTTPGCFVPLEPLPGTPELPSELAEERARLLAELQSLDQGPAGGAEPEMSTPLADARAQRVHYRGVARCEGLVAVVSFDHSFDDASDPGVVSGFEMTQGCSEDDAAVEWRPRAEVELDDQRSFRLSGSGFVVDGQRRGDGSFVGMLSDPGFEVTCDDVAYALCNELVVTEAQPSP